MSTPWGGVPAASFEFGLADHDGVLALFAVGGLHRDVSTSFGERDAVRAGIVLLDGPEAGKVFEDILLFNTRVVSRLRNAPGQVILARIGMGEGKGGNNKPVELYEATPADQDLAMRWHNHFPGKLDQVRAAVAASFQAEERKAAQPNGRVQSQPHPTHAGTRAPINRGQAQRTFYTQHDPQQAQQPVYAPDPYVPPNTYSSGGGWASPPQSPTPPDPWAQPAPAPAPAPPAQAGPEQWQRYNDEPPF